MIEAQACGAVSAGDARTASAGGQILGQGGNAVDAAVGGTFAAFAAEPVLTGPFGGGFALVAAPKLDPIAYDIFADIPGRGLPPAKTQPGLDFQGLEVSFGPTTQVFHAGRGSAAAPLLLPGLLQLHAEHGRLPLRDVLAPAIALAESGVPLSAQIAPIAKILTPILTLTPETAQLFAPHGTVLAPDEVFRSPALAALLRQVSHGGHHGVREALLQSFGPPAGLITEADIKTSHVKTHTPVHVAVGDTVVALNPPPSLGGMLVGVGLELLRLVDDAVWEDETQTFCHLLACLAVTQEMRNGHVDPAARHGSDALAALEPTIFAPAFTDRLRARQAELLHAGTHGHRPPPVNLGSTTHVSVIDKDGMACCITSSNGEGCGHVVPGCGVMANNFLGEEDINPGGFHVRPSGERMTSMMCPTIVLRDGKPQLALGTGGSNRIRTALLQVLVHHLLRKVPLADAVRMPRLHYEGGALFVEREVFGIKLSQKTLDVLARRVASVVYFDAPNMFFGGVHVAAAGGVGVGDPRRGGAVAVG